VNVGNLIVRGRPQVTIWRMRIACWMPKATNTHSKYVKFIASPHKVSTYAHRYYVICTLTVCRYVGLNYARSKAWVWAAGLVRLRVGIPSVCGCLCVLFFECCKIDLSVLADHPTSGYLQSVSVSECGLGALIISRSRSTIVCCVVEKCGGIILEVTLRESSHYVEEQPALGPVLTRTR